MGSHLFLHLSHKDNVCHIWSCTLRTSIWSRPLFAEQLVQLGVVRQKFAPGKKYNKSMMRMKHSRPGLGLLRQFHLFRYFPHLLESKHWLSSEYHVHVCQVSPQLSCGDTWQIWMRFKALNSYFHKSRDVKNGEINELYRILVTLTSDCNTNACLDISVNLQMWRSRHLYRTKIMALIST